MWQRLPLWSGINVHRYSPFHSFTCVEYCCGYTANHEYMVNAGTGMGAAAVFERGDSVDELCNARKVEKHTYLSKDAP